MNASKTKCINKSYDEIISLIKKSNFFCEMESPSLEYTFFSEINIENIDLPFRLKCFVHKQGIISLKELLNTKYGKILRCRNIGIRTIEKSRKVIIDYLNKIQDCFRNLETEDNKTRHYDTRNIVVKYFPMLKGTFRTTRLNFNLTYKDICCINIPKRIEEYIRKNKLNIINDLLNINYYELNREPNTGRKTISKLQLTLIDLLGLEKIIFLAEQKKYELITIPKTNPAHQSH